MTTTVTRGYLLYCTLVWLLLPWIPVHAQVARDAPTISTDTTSFESGSFQLSTGRRTEDVSAPPPSSIDSSSTSTSKPSSTTIVLSPGISATKNSSMNVLVISGVLAIVVVLVALFVIISLVHRRKKHSRDSLEMMSITSGGDEGYLSPNTFGLPGPKITARRDPVSADRRRTFELIAPAAVSCEDQALSHTPLVEPPPRYQ